MTRNKHEHYASLECSKNIILVRMMHTQQLINANSRQTVDKFFK